MLYLIYAIAYLTFFSAYTSSSWKVFPMIEPIIPPQSSASPDNYQERVDVLRYVNYLARRAQEEAENNRHDHSAYLVSLIQYWLVQQWGLTGIQKPRPPRHGGF